MQHRKMSLQTTEAEKQKKKRGTYSDARQAIKKKKGEDIHTRELCLRRISPATYVYTCALVCLVVFW